MKRFSCGFLALTLLITTVRFSPPTFAAKSSDGGAGEGEAAAVEVSPSIEAGPQTAAQTNRFLVRGASPIQVGDVLGDASCISSRPL